MTTRLRFASLLHDRIDPLRRGSVRLAGFELETTILETPREIADRALDQGECEAAELSIAEFICMAARGDRRFVAIPAFPGRAFRHGALVVNRNAGIEGPKDLEGRRIGVPLYTHIDAVWLRGHLRHQYGVDLDTIHWVQGALEKPGVHGMEQRIELVRPADITVNVSGRSLTDLLIAGRIDAVLGARPPRPHPDMRRLFPNFRQVERDFYRKTHIFPILDVVALRRELHEAHPGLAQSLYDALAVARQESLRQNPAQRGMLPWAMDELIEPDEVFGPDPCPDGVEANRVTLTALAQYMAEQGLIAVAPPIESLFVLLG